MNHPDENRPSLSVIIPVLNEERQIGDLLSDLAARQDLHEVIVVDGGSEDRTRDIVRSHDCVTLTLSGRGRGMQMNEGASLATGSVLLFLHADTRLPAEVATCIREAFRDPAVVAGAFRVETKADHSPMWLRPLLRLADLRSRFSSLPYGDQAMFVRADSFREAGGFPEIAIMEDLELSRRLREIGTIRLVPSTVAVSGRRFVARPLYYAVAMNLLPLLYRLGVSPTVLSRLYGDPR